MSRVPLRVLVVDDSALVREVFRMMLPESDGFSVATAADPLIAVRRMAEQRPDVLVLDLEMPHMDGLTFLRRIMASDPLPVVICSALGTKGSELSLKALEEGAIEVIAKPTLGLRRFLEENADTLAQTVRAASGARVNLRARGSAPLPVRAEAAPAIRLTSDRIVAVAASTGGTEAIRELISSLPLDTPPIVVVQHMPPSFTRAFAQRLDRDTPLKVAEASDGEWLTPGKVLIAPGDRHLTVRRSGAHYRAALDGGAPVSRHRPSADVLFGSVAAVAGACAVGVILTGMGSDGAEGLKRMHDAGAFTIAQDEQSSVVFGMPREAIALGGVDRILPLTEIPAAILAHSGARVSELREQGDDSTLARRSTRSRLVPSS